MEAHEFIRETFDLDDKISINELPNLPISLVVKMLINYKQDKVEKLTIPVKKKRCHSGGVIEGWEHCFICTFEGCKDWY